MGRKKFEPEYKKEVIKLVTERGMKISDVAKDVGVSDTSIRRWIKAIANMVKMLFLVKAI